MSWVKRIPAEELHVPLLMGLLFREVSTVLDSPEWNGLRQSHVRVVSGVPAEGISITELGERVGTTKQGCGQFVRGLVQRGLLAIDRDPEDRRVRVVRRTPLGEQTIAAVTRRMLEVEAEWAGRVGERRYRTFR